MQLLVYAEKNSPRADYIFSTLLPAAGFLDYTLTTEKTFFEEHTGAKINYSCQSISQEEFWIRPRDLLFDNVIKEQVIDPFNWNATKAFFKTDGSDFPFDIFAASFYLISRYEEYLPHKCDIYGRYAHENSLAWKEGFLKLPLVNIWLQQLASELLKKFPSLHLKRPTFDYLPTYDIDIAWSYLNKGWLRNAGGLLRSVIGSEWSRAGERMNVLLGTKKDPFDSYEWLDELHEEHQLKAVYFFLLAKRNENYDKNILPRKNRLQKLIQYTASKHPVGVHPSWQSGYRTGLLKNEIKTLETIIGSPVTRSRQHYIRMTLPQTYRRLIDAGITQEYSMGYGSINGFRASYCLPYKWYDLKKEEVASLTVYPFCYMDANSYYEQRYGPEEALAEMEYYYKVTKEVNGLLITVWHNQFFGTDSMFTGWREAYKTIAVRIMREAEVFKIIH